ncbi:NfeD family protein [Romboutsia sp.]|uniref:NfeD family protein n=1 Tax=Romboutsia sp. TaxID=1965302 RepID=UPI003F3EB075
MKLLWLAIAIGFAIGEVMTTTLTLIWFSIGAVIVMFLSSFIKNIFIQIIIFAVISTAMLIIATKKFVKEDKNYKYDTNLQAIINKRAIVKETIQKNKTGIVVLEGEEWTAVSINEEYIEKDEVVNIIKIEGVKLVVEKSK